MAALLLAECSARLESERRIRFRAGDDVVAFLLDRGGWEPSLGARPMRGAVQRLVEGPLAEKILAGEFGSGDEVVVAADGDSLRFARA